MDRNAQNTQSDFESENLRSGSIYHQNYVNYESSKGNTHKLHSERFYFEAKVIL